MGQLLVALGFEDVVVTKYSGDGGIDLRATLAVGGVTDVRTAVTGEALVDSVSGRTVGGVRGGLGPHEHSYGDHYCSDFTKDARREAEAADRSPISLINGDGLVDLANGETRSASVTQPRDNPELDEGSLLPSDDALPEGPEQLAEFRPLATEQMIGCRQDAQRVAASGRRASMEAEPRRRAPVRRGLGADDARRNEWMLGQFDRLNSEKVARGYWQVPRSFGLARDRRRANAVDGGRRSTYAESGDSGPASWRFIRQSVAGFDELLAALHAKRRCSTRRRDSLCLNDEARRGLGVRCAGEVPIELAREPGRQ